MFRIESITNPNNLPYFKKSRCMVITFVSNEFIKNESEKQIETELYLSLFYHFEIVNTRIFYDNLDEIKKNINIINLIKANNNIDVIIVNFLTDPNECKFINKILIDNGYDSIKHYYLMNKDRLPHILKLGYTGILPNDDILKIKEK